MKLYHVLEGVSLFVGLDINVFSFKERKRVRGKRIFMLNPKLEVIEICLNKNYELDN